MPTVFWDLETFSNRDLTECGSSIYAADPSTDILFMCFAVDDGEVQTWRPGDPLAAPFANPAGYTFVSDNWDFERGIHAQVLVKRYGFAPIPLAQHDCAQRRALANAFPAELGLRCTALGLPYKKDPEARKALLRLCRPQKPKKRKKPEDPAARARDLELVLQRCKTDVESTRAAYNHPRLRPLSPDEQQVLLHDAMINTRGITANMPFLQAGLALATKERNTINTRLNELTAGVVTSVFQRDRIIKAINARGHAMTSLTKRSVAATLAHKLEDYVREILMLRQRGAYNSVQKNKKLLAFADSDDHRIRCVLRYHGAGPGRWTSLGANLHNLSRNDDEYPASLIAAILVGDRAELARYGDPIEIISQLSRAALCATDGNELIRIDLTSIESRIPTWLAGETWKLKNFRQYDATGDKNLDHYRILAHFILRKNSSVENVSAAERQLGKCAELAAGFGGSVGAWRRIAHDEDIRTDAEVLAIIHAWRNKHPAICAFWQRLARAARLSIHTRQSIRVMPAPLPSIITSFDGTDLTITLPNGRAINYPNARLVPNKKFENGDADIEFMDNAHGQWKPARAWFGILIENTVQGIARDLLAAAIIRAETRWPGAVVFHCHDELVLEAPIGAISAQDALACMLEAPAWAEGLPLGGKVQVGPLYLDAPATAEPPKQDILERAIDEFVANTRPNEAIAVSADEDFIANLDNTYAPLTELVSLPIDSSKRVSCPFHDDPNPSCSIYPDHYFCHACKARGDRIDWLTKVEGMTKAEAITALYDWSGPIMAELTHSIEEKLEFALDIWNAALPLIGSIGEHYFADTRGIDVSKLPSTIHEVLRFHPHCVFGAGTFCPCIIALMRDPLTDAPVGVHRIGLEPTNGKVSKLNRMALGRMGVVKLWPLNGGDQLVVGEGIETVLAAATRIPYRGTALTPAWSTVNSEGMGRLPALPNVKQLVLLIDNDENYEGQQAAERCQRIWKSADRTTVPLIPKQKGWDFNDVVLGRKA